MYSPKFTISNTILKNIGIIEGAREVIDHAPLLPYYEKKFQDDALVRSVHHGTHIEGNELNLSQAERIIMGQQVIARQRDIQEVINYRRVMDYIGEAEEKNLPYKITQDLIFRMHRLTVYKLIPPETIGKYRNIQVVIKNNHTGQISFRPASKDSVPIQMSDLVEFINSNSSREIHPVLRSGIFHYEFVRIHPFVEGNGRVARALSTYILFTQGYDIRRFFSLEEYFDSDTGNYYEALQNVQKNNGDLTNWLEYFTKGLAIELTKVKERVENISTDVKIKHKLGDKPLLLTDRQLKIIEYIQKTGFLENKAFRSLFPMISEDTVLNEIKVLLKNNIIKKRGSTKSAKYVMK